jgi:hypothetical protein
MTMRKHCIYIAIALSLAAGPALAQQPGKRIGGAVGQGLDKAEKALGLPVPTGTGALNEQPPQADNAVTNALIKPFQDLAAFIHGDANGAAALAIAVPEIQDGNGLACWTSMQTAGKVFDAHPIPLTFRVMTDFQALRLWVITANRLCDNTACTVVFADGTNIVNAAAPLSAGVGLPSLQGLCSKIAHINLVTPQ